MAGFELVLAELVGSLGRVLLRLASFCAGGLACDPLVFGGCSITAI